MLLRFINFKKFDAYLNMAIDEAISIFVRKGKSPPTFRFYGWNKPSITIGEFQKIDDVSLEFCKEIDIPVVRRPTGGKGILHFDDITYSFSSRKEYPFNGNLFRSYEIISQFFLKTFQLCGLDVEYQKEKHSVNRSALCFARSSFGELCYGGFKILGSAQKRWSDGFLQQGTIPLSVNKDLLIKVFKNYDTSIDKILGVKDICVNFDIQNFIDNFKQSLRSFSFDVIEESFQQEELDLAQEIIEKYQNPQWLLERSL